MTSAVVHATYGLTELYIKGLLTVGQPVDDIICISTQPQETRNALRLLPSEQVLRVGRRPTGAATYWEGMGPTSALLRATAASPDGVGGLLLADRHLRRFPSDVGLAWLNQIADRYAALLVELRPSIILGEVSNASEVVLSALAKCFGATYATPATLRIPNHLFAFWVGPAATRIWRSSCREVPETRRLTQPSDDPERPFYFYPNNRPPSVMSPRSAEVLWTKCLDLARIRDHAMQNPRLGDYARLPWLNRVRKARYGRTIQRRVWTDLPQMPYAFFPLHVQPEASIDWFGDEWRNQIDVAEILARALRPHGIALVVKDHSNFVWSRGRWFHQRLQQLDNVYLVNPQIDSRAVAAGSAFTFTISGTIGLESGLRGGVVLTVAELPWTQLPTVRHVQSREQLMLLIGQRWWTDVRQDDGLVGAWHAQYAASGWPALIADRYGYPEVLERQNLDGFAAGLRELLSGVGAT